LNVNRILVLEGYTNPFGDSRRKQHHLGGTMRRRRSLRGMQQSKFKACVAEWKASGKRGKYTAHMSRCLKK
jgi:hypothetical protein